MVKQLLTKALILVPPTKGEPLLLYIAATTQVVSVALVVEREEEGHAFKVQHPVYTSSARSYPTQRPTTPKSRNFCTLSSSLGGSYATTSSHTR